MKPSSASRSDPDAAIAGPAGLRVAYVLWNHPAPSERFIRREIEGLRRIGITIDVLALDPSPRVAEAPGAVHRAPGWLHPARWRALTLAFRHPARCVRLLEGVARVARMDGWKGLVRAVRMGWLAAYFLSRAEVPRPDLVHAHFANLPTVFARLWAGALDRPWGFSLHAHDLYAERLALAERVRDCSYALTCSHAAERELRGRIPLDLHPRVQTLYHGIEVDAWRRRTARAPAATARILAVGRLVPKKGFQVLLDACGRLVERRLDFECELIGDGPEREALLRRIRERSLTDRVRLLGWLPETELRERFERASVLAVPSVVAPDGDRDNVPNVLVEGLLMEVPVVASALPAIDEVLSPEGLGLLVPPGDPEALSAALHEVCTREELASGLCERARSYAESRFDLRRSSERLKELFASVATGACARER